MCVCFHKLKKKLRNNKGCDTFVYGERKMEMTLIEVGILIAKTIHSTKYRQWKRTKLIEHLLH